MDQVLLLHCLFFIHSLGKLFFPLTGRALQRLVLLGLNIYSVRPIIHIDVRTKPLEINRIMNGSLTLEMLTEDIYNDAQWQITEPPEAYGQIIALALEAGQMLPNSGIKDGVTFKIILGPGKLHQDSISVFVGCQSRNG